MSVTIVVHGKPQPAGSKTAFVNPKTGKAIITDAAKQSRPWKQEVAGAALATLNAESPRAPLPIFPDGPLDMTVTFYVTRPKSHYGTGTRSDVLKDSAPLWPTSKPDVSKLVRAVEDALTGIVYRDDAQIAVQEARKVYRPAAGCCITIRALKTGIDA